MTECTFSPFHDNFMSEINPLRQVPAIVDGRFKLFERYLGTFILLLQLWFTCTIHMVFVWKGMCITRALQSFLICNFEQIHGV